MSRVQAFGRPRDSADIQPKKRRHLDMKNCQRLRDCPSRHSLFCEDKTCNQEAVGLKGTEGHPRKTALVKLSMDHVLRETLQEALLQQEKTLTGSTRTLKMNSFLQNLLSQSSMSLGCWKQLDETNPQLSNSSQRQAGLTRVWGYRGKWTTDNDMCVPSGWRYDDSQTQCWQAIVACNVVTP